MPTPVSGAGAQCWAGSQQTAFVNTWDCFVPLTGFSSLLLCNLLQNSPRRAPTEGNAEVLPVSQPGRMYTSMNTKPSCLLSDVTMDRTQEESWGRDWVFNLSQSLKADLWREPHGPNGAGAVDQRVGAGPPHVHIPASSALAQR